MKATTDKTKRSTPSTLPGEGGSIPVTDNGTDAYKPSWGGVRREASPSLCPSWRRSGAALMETQESPEPRSVPGSLFLLRSSLLIVPPALLFLPLFTGVRGIGILRTSPLTISAKFVATEFKEVRGSGGRASRLDLLGM